LQINLGARKIHCKIVYYGPGCSGKTTNIQKVHEHMPQDRKSALTSIATEGDRTLFFDFMSLDLGQVGGMDTCFQLYTVPG
jgi:mutual gliding-motility protein MglA